MGANQLSGFTINLAHTIQFFPIARFDILLRNHFQIQHRTIRLVRYAPSLIGGKPRSARLLVTSQNPIARMQNINVHCSHSLIIANRRRAIITLPATFRAAILNLTFDKLSQNCDIIHHPNTPTKRTQHQIPLPRLNL